MSRPPHPLTPRPERRHSLGVKVVEVRRYGGELEQKPVANVCECGRWSCAITVDPQDVLGRWELHVAAEVRNS